MHDCEVIRFRALRIRQPSGRSVFSFPTTAETLLKLTEVPHIGRGEDMQLIGYQRPEVASHIAEIRRYLESENAVLPNTIVVAFNQEVNFTPVKPRTGDETLGGEGIGEWGEITLALPEKGEPRPAFVVDGQQRLAAIATTRHEAFPFFVTALIAPDIAEQRKQFVLVNRTKPLPQGMIYELLPEIEGTLPVSLARQQVAAQLAARLNLDPNSALYQQVRTPTCPVGQIKDNSLRRATLNSLSDGALLDITRSRRNDPGLYDHMAHMLDTFWRGVAEAFPDAWGKSPKTSRLTHGVGIVALGFVMDYLYMRRPAGVEWTVAFVREGLRPLAPHCAWTEGVWRFGNNEDRAWNGLQNTDRDVRILTAFLRRLLTGASLPHKGEQPDTQESLGL